MLEGQVNNGGFDQFFFNSSGDYTNEILSAYRKIKAQKTVALIEEAIILFPVSPVPRDTMTRRKIMQEINENLSDGWNALDNKFYEYEENIGELLISYIKANSELVGR